MSLKLVAKDKLIDPLALAARLQDLAGSKLELGSAARQKIIDALKEALAAGRAEAERRLKDDGRGTLCAMRLAHLQDAIITALHELAVECVYRVDNPSAGERMTVVAVGGYGRGTLAPGSDVDLLFVLPYKQTPWGESVVEFILYALWDLGLKVGHATRSADQCIRLSRSDMTVRTSILETRYLCGDTALLDDLQIRFDKEIVRRTGPEFAAAKLAERDARHTRQGASRYLVEPNVKEGKGGLRDLHTLFWIGKYLFRVSGRDELVKAGVFTPAELRQFRKAEDFLWAVRCHLHFVTGRAEERLSFDVQQEMAARLGYTSHAGLRDVERFMRHYFLVAKDVGDLTRVFCADLEEHHAKPAPVLNRYLGLKPRRRRMKAIGGSADFVVDNNRINIADERVFERDPVNLIRIFHVADRHGLAFHPDAMRQIGRSLKIIDGDLRADAEANRLFLEIVSSPRQPEIILRKMNESGVLGRFIREFGKIVSMMQFNMYHHYTVDEHLLRSIGVLAEIEHGNLAEPHPLADEIMPGLRDRVVLYVALLLHDIAKGQPEDHSLAGARIARRLCPRLGLDARQTETVAWLVEQHLTMSMVAQSRDLNDRRTILDFAAVVQSLEHLKMLLILTVADIKAVGPGVWNGWKGQLLRTLYYQTEPILSGGHSQISQKQRTTEAQFALAAALPDWSARARNAYLKRHHPAYWLRVDLEQKVRHARLIRKADRAKVEFATDFAMHAFEGISEITVFAPDHPRLLSLIAGACTVAGADIVHAQIFTTTTGQALDSIATRCEFDSEADERRRAGRIAKLLEGALSGENQLPELVPEKDARKRRVRAFSLEAVIAVENDWSDHFTVIEASGLDRSGLLYDLTREISALNLNIRSAHVGTFGERAIDVFYVTDLAGQKVTNANRRAAIRRRLKAAFDGRKETPPAPRSPASRKPVPA
ncbi:MAG: [protein-PII] uridylyltransferase [Alphaproteobacteria bacterium]